MTLVQGAAASLLHGLLELKLVAPGFRGCVCVFVCCLKFLRVREKQGRGASGRQWKGAVAEGEAGGVERGAKEMNG